MNRIGPDPVVESVNGMAILDALPAHVALVDANGLIISVNEAWKRFAAANGMRPEGSGVGCNYLDVCDDATGPEASGAQRVGDGLRAVLQGREESFATEYACHSPTERRWIALTIKPVPAGRTRGAILMHEDITARKDAAQAVQQTLERLTEAQKIAQIGDWDFDIATGTISWSPQVYEIFGRDPALGPPRDYDEHASLYSPASRVILGINIDRAVASGEPQEYELEILPESRPPVYVQAVAVPVKDEDGAVRRIHGTIQDISARRYAELASAELSVKTALRERMLSSLLSSITDFAYIYDRDGRFVFVNQPLLDLWGITLDEAIGKDFADLGYPDDLAKRLKREIDEVFETKKIATGETPYVSPTGVDAIYEYIFSPVIGADGAVEFVVGSTRDITERKRSENALRASDDKFHQFAANVQDVFWIRSIDMSELHFLSPGFERIWGRPVESLRSNPTSWTDFIAPEDRERVIAAFGGLRYDQPSVDLEYRIVRPDGEIRWVRARGFQIRDADGTHVRNIGVATDITEQQKAQDAVRHSQKRMRDVFDGLGPSMFVALLTADGIVIEINHAPLQAAGVRAEDVIGMPFPETHWWTYSPEVQVQLREAIVRARQGESSRYDARTRGAGNATIDIDFSLEPLREDSGNIRFLIASASVITDRKIAEAALRQAQKMEAVGQLAAGVAHEFNNLLQALMSASAILRYKAATPAIAKTGTDLESLIKRGAGLTQQLLLFARENAIERTTLDLTRVIRAASEFLRPLMPETIAIVVEVPSEAVNVEADAGQIQQVLLNLAINARDAMPEGGTLTVRAGRVGDEVFQEVEDTGHGMSAEIRAHLFEPFFTTKKPGKGTGLGLAVAHGIIEQHGGRFEVHSSPGEGSRFRMILPASISRETAIHEPATEAGLVSGTGRVFLVEDDEPVREGVAILLDLMGYEVITARSGEEALELTVDPPPQVLLSDVTLSGIAGPRVAALLRERWPDMKVVLMSGYFEETVQSNATRDGWHFLQKPFEADELAGVLSTAMSADVVM